MGLGLKLDFKKTLLSLTLALGTGASLLFALEYDRIQDQARIDEGLKSERIDSLSRGAMRLSQALNREVESLYHQGVLLLQTQDSIRTDSALLHVAEWGWTKTPQDLRILTEKVQAGLDPNWQTSYLDRLGDEIVSWNGILGVETQSLTWKSPDQNEMYFTWVIPSGGRDRKVRTILVKTSQLHALKSEANAYLLSGSGVLLSHPHSSENLTRAERLFRLSERPTRPGSNAPFVSRNADGSSVVVSIQPISGMGAKLALEETVTPGIVLAKTSPLSLGVLILISCGVFFLSLRLWAWPSKSVQELKSSSSDHRVLKVGEYELSQLAEKKTKPVTQSAPAQEIESMSQATFKVEPLKPAEPKQMAPAARETILDIDEAVSEFDWAKISQELEKAALKPSDSDRSTRGLGPHV